MAELTRPAPTAPESIAAYERNAAEIETHVAKLDDAAWDRKARFLVEGLGITTKQSLLLVRLSLSYSHAAG